MKPRKALAAGHVLAGMSKGLFEYSATRCGMLTGSLKRPMLYGLALR